jgi:hypothetical protein
VYLNRGVAFGIGKHAGGGELFPESGFEGYPAVELADGGFGRDIGTVKHCQFAFAVTAGSERGFFHCFYGLFYDVKLVIISGL